MSTSAIRLVAVTPPMIPVGSLLHQAAFGREGWDTKSLTELLAMPGAQGRFAIDAGDEPLGFSLYLLVADTAELLTLAVAPTARRRGVATILLADFLECAKQFGATNAFLEVAEDNIPAISLYNREGFRFEARRPDYYRRTDNIPVAAHVLRCPLVQI